MSKNTKNTKTSGKATVAKQAPASSGKAAPVTSAAPKVRTRAGKLDYFAALIHAAADGQPDADIRALADKVAHRLTGPRANSPTGKNPETIPGKRLALISGALAAKPDRKALKALADSLLPTLSTPANVEIYDTQERNDLAHVSAGLLSAEDIAE